MKILLSIFISIMFIGCTDTNPLIGKWSSTKNIMIMKNIEFTEDKLIFEGIVSKVEYEIDEKKVIVTDQFGIGTIYNIIDSNTISINLPAMGVITYTKQQ